MPDLAVEPYYCGFCIGAVCDDGTCPRCEWHWGAIKLTEPQARAFRRGWDTLADDEHATTAERFTAGADAVRAELAR